MKLDRNLSANQITKIAANERQNNPPVNRKACAADVIAPLHLMRSPSANLSDNRRTDVAIDQFGDHAVREDHGAPREP